jgi:hypothetical protein
VSSARADLPLSGQDLLGAGQDRVEPVERLRLVVYEGVDQALAGLHLLGDPVHPGHRGLEAGGQILHGLHGLDPGLEHLLHLERLARHERLPRLARGHRGGAEGDLDDLVAEQPLGRDARLRVAADPLRESPRDREGHPHLAPGLLGQRDRGHAPDLHPGQPHGGALNEAAHLDELDGEVVLALEVAGLRPQQVDDRHEHEQAREDEGADADLQGELGALGGHG